MEISRGFSHQTPQLRWLSETFSPGIPPIPPTLSFARRAPYHLRSPESIIPQLRWLRVPGSPQRLPQSSAYSSAALAPNSRPSSPTPQKSDLFLSQVTYLSTRSSPNYPTMLLVTHSCYRPQLLIILANTCSAYGTVSPPEPFTPSGGCLPHDPLYCHRLSSLSVLHDLQLLPRVRLSCRT